MLFIYAKIRFTSISKIRCFHQSTTSFISTFVFYSISFKVFINVNTPNSHLKITFLSFKKFDKCYTLGLPT